MTGINSFSFDKNDESKLTINGHADNVAVLVGVEHNGLYGNDTRAQRNAIPDGRTHVMVLSSHNHLEERAAVEKSGEKGPRIGYMVLKKSSIEMFDRGIPERVRNILSNGISGMSSDFMINRKCNTENEKNRFLRLRLKATRDFLTGMKSYFTLGKNREKQPVVEHQSGFLRPLQARADFMNGMFDFKSLKEGVVYEASPNFVEFLDNTCHRIVQTKNAYNVRGHVLNSHSPSMNRFRDFCEKLDVLKREQTVLNKRSDRDLNQHRIQSSEKAPVNRNLFFKVHNGGVHVMNDREVRQFTHENNKNLMTRMNTGNRVHSKEHQI